MASDLEAIKKIILQNYKAYQKPISALAVAKLLGQVKESSVPYDNVMRILEALERGHAIKGDCATGYIPLYEEVKS